MFNLNFDLFIIAVVAGKQSLKADGVSISVYVQWLKKNRLFYHFQIEIDQT